MKIFLFCGFLGSGKTTMVVQIAKYLVKEKKRKVMLIVNDVGDVGIDAQLMKKMHTEVHEIFGGCICGQLGNLINLLSGIGEKYDVNIVLLEVSGIAQPIRFVDTMKKFLSDNDYIYTIALVDASRFEELTQVLPDLINSQISFANLVVINKIDAVGEINVKNVEEYITGMRPNVMITKLSSINDDDVNTLLGEKINEFRA